jgi:hypothetical protein
VAKQPQEPEWQHLLEGGLLFPSAHYVKLHQAAEAMSAESRGSPCMRQGCRAGAAAVTVCHKLVMPRLLLSLLVAASWHVHQLDTTRLACIGQHCIAHHTSRVLCLAQ